MGKISLTSFGVTSRWVSMVKSVTLLSAYGNLESQPSDLSPQFRDGFYSQTSAPGRSPDDVNCRFPGTAQIFMRSAPFSLRRRISMDGSEETAFDPDTIFHHFEDRATQLVVQEALETILGACFYHKQFSLTPKTTK